MSAIEGVREVEALQPAEAGDGIASLRVATSSDVREAVSRSLVQAGFGILQFSKEKELENMFLELLGEDQGQPGRKRRKKKKKKPGEPDTASANASNAAPQTEEPS